MEEYARLAKHKKSLYYVLTRLMLRAPGNRVHAGRCRLRIPSHLSSTMSNNAPAEPWPGEGRGLIRPPAELVKRVFALFPDASRCGKIPTTIHPHRLACQKL
jgi:hypothetical protein